MYLHQVVTRDTCVYVCVYFSLRSRSTNNNDEHNYKIKDSLPKNNIFFLNFKKKKQNICTEIIKENPKEKAKETKNHSTHFSG